MKEPLDLPPIDDSDVPSDDDVDCYDWTAEEILAYRASKDGPRPVCRPHSTDPEALAEEHTAIDAEDEAIFGESVTRFHRRRISESN